MWQLKYNNDFLDIQPDQHPEIERRSPLFLVDDFLAEYSTPITLPYSDTNSRILGNYFFSLTVKQKKKIDVEIYIHGTYKERATLVIESAGMNTSFSGLATLSGYLLLGVSDFFSLIQHKKLGQLTLGGPRTYDFTSFLPSDGSNGYWQHVQDTWNFTHDYVFPPCKNMAIQATDWEVTSGTDFTGWMNKLYNNEIDTNMQPLFPWPKLEYVLNQIFVEHNWKLDTSQLNDTDWKKLLLFSAYAIPTTTGLAFRSSIPSQGGRTILLEPARNITIELGKAMPQDVTCAALIMAICKRYGWVPICNAKQRICTLTALKEVGKRTPKDWTELTEPSIQSSFPQDTRTFAFKNTFTGDDSYPSERNFEGFKIGTPVYAFKNLPTPSPFYDGQVIYSHLENKYYQLIWDDDLAARIWIPYMDNIYDEGPENASDNFETECTTLPINNFPLNEAPATPIRHALVPVCEQTRYGKWGIRTIFYHGMVKQTLDNGSAHTDSYPYASSTYISATSDSTLTWSNVYSHKLNNNDFGIIPYWFQKWINMNTSSEQEVKMNFNLPLYELIKYQWDDIILVQNVPYFIKSFVQPLDHTEFISIEATMQRMMLSHSNSGSQPPVLTPPPTDTNFGNESVLHTYPSYQTTQCVNGPANATVTIKVTSYTASNPDFYILIDGVEKNLNDTFNVTLAPDGTASFSLWISPLNHGDHGTITVELSITGTTIGALATPNTHSYSLTQ